LYLQNIPFSPLKISQIFIFPHPVFGRSGCQLSNSTVIFLSDVSDVWKWPNPVKTINVPFLLRNPQWNHRALSQCWCKGEKHENKQNYNC
jgi:hypothetical protein